ncbi:MAG: hypothetical protein PWQ59_144 [Thermoanaerobacterium sp.]|nr:hypothetical protein [Thermoanaerobacterium sp.]
MLIFDYLLNYRAQGRIGKNGDYYSWQFVFTNEDIARIFEYLDGKQNLIIALVCGKEKLDESEFAVLNSEEIKQCIGKGRTSCTISRAKGEKAFRISIGGGRDNSIRIPSNRLVG